MSVGRSTAVRKPANIRIVQSFERYIDAYGPRVYGYCPGNSPLSGPYTASTGTPDIVSKSELRCDAASNACCHSARLLMRAMLRPQHVGDAVVASGRVPAVDRDRLTADERRVGRSEECGD